MNTSPAPRSAAARRWGGVGEVFWVFLRLGVTSFGGPVAHLGYFREAFVERRRWLTDRAYADLVALCQFLPGPASSQVGMAIGLQRAGMLGLLAAWAGMLGLLAAWAGFTLPSAILLVGFAYGAASLGDAIGSGWLVGLKATAVAVVAHAVLGMAKTLTPDARRATIAVSALIVVLLVPGVLAQVVAIIAAGIVGWAWLRPSIASAQEADAFSARVPRTVAVGRLIVFVLLLAVLPILVAVTGNGTVGLVDVFYRAGSLVFGGGHVVLPLLEAETVQTGLVGHDAFLAGYGAAQAAPGPMFTFAAYLGAVTTTGPTGIAGAAIALVAIFLPSALLIVGALPFWERLRHARHAQRALAGVNAGVVGILAAALYTPVFTQGVTGAGTLAVAALAFVALTTWKTPAWVVVIAAQRLSPGDVGLELLENSIATALGLSVLILIFQPLSGAHFNPVVTLAARTLGASLSAGAIIAYAAAQVVGGIGGAVLANAMFDAPTALSTTERATAGHLLGEVVATAGLILLIFALVRTGRPALAGPAVGAYIGAAYWFTSSTSFANPAVTIGRIFTDTFSGIAPTSAWAFLAAQFVGTAVGVGLVLLLFPSPRKARS